MIDFNFPRRMRHILDNFLSHITCFMLPHIVILIKPSVCSTIFINCILYGLARRR